MNAAARRAPVVLAIAAAIALLVGGCGAAESGPVPDTLTVSTIANSLGQTAIVLTGIDGDRPTTPDIQSGRLQVVDGCIVLETDKGEIYTLILPENAEFLENGSLNTTQGDFAVGEELALRGDVLPASELSYADQLPEGCSAFDYLAVNQINN